jgi:hypothetical protein
VHVGIKTFVSEISFDFCYLLLFFDPAGWEPYDKSATKWASNYKIKT